MLTAFSIKKMDGYSEITRKLKHVTAVFLTASIAAFVIPGYYALLYMVATHFFLFVKLLTQRTKVRPSRMSHVLHVST